MSDMILTRYRQSHGAMRMQLSARRTGLIKPRKTPETPVSTPKQEQTDIT